VTFAASTPVVPAVIVEPARGFPRFRQTRTSRQVLLRLGVSGSTAGHRHRCAGRHAGRRRTHGGSSRGRGRGRLLLGRSLGVEVDRVGRVAARPRCPTDRTST
jgi:hypothetical protein